MLQWAIRSQVPQRVMAWDAVHRLNGNGRTHTLLCGVCLRYSRTPWETKDQKKTRVSCPLRAYGVTLFLECDGIIVDVLGRTRATLTKAASL